MREIEKDGFITREEDLMISEPLEYGEKMLTENACAQPMQECVYPMCEKCIDYRMGYCTVPMVVSKQIYLDLEQKLAKMENDIADIEKLVIDEILGEDDAPQKTLTMYKNITWDEVDV